MFQVIFLIMFLVFSQCNAQSNFLVPESNQAPGKKSKTTIKEELGDELKDALYNSVSFSNYLGEMQSSVSRLQEQLLSNVESLVGNDKKFKRAGKTELQNASKLMSKICDELKSQKKTIEDMLMVMNNGGCLKCERIIHEKGLPSRGRALRR